MTITTTDVSTQRAGEASAGLQPQLQQEPQLQENEFLGHVLKPDGKKELRWIGGKKTEVDLPEEILMGIPAGLRKKHIDFLFALEAVAAQAVTAGRKISLLQEELLRVKGVTKHLIKECERWGFLETQIITLGSAGRNLGGHKAVVLSPQGKALLKHMGDALAEAVQGVESSVQALENGEQNGG